MEDGATFFFLNSGTRDGVMAGPCGGDSFELLGGVGGRRSNYSSCDLGFLLLCGVFVLGPNAFFRLCLCVLGSIFSFFLCVYLSPFYVLFIYG